MIAINRDLYSKLFHLASNIKIEAVAYGFEDKKSWIPKKNKTA